MQAFQIPIRVFERFWRTIEAYACQPFTGHDNGRKNPTSPHTRKAMVERWPADEGGRRHRRFFLPPPAAAQGVEKVTAEFARSMRSSATRRRSRRTYGRRGGRAPRRRQRHPGRWRGGERGEDGEDGKIDGRVTGVAWIQF
uniref:Uncharacterized protein n=1 Tax=Oryza sativa subsp. japonica TaxID=39947 RepID=Q6YVD8_ORYSJ|nr:hypothetical protein [Oryza sativa Japonica Group]BAD32062.1 hypothetical protein [Oryza sativa Japonica Group]